MSITVFKKWTRAVSHLDEKIKNSRLIAGRNIQLENTGNGIRIHGSASGTQSGDTYNGYFKLVKDGEVFNIIDAVNPDSSNCGYVVIGNTRTAVPKASGFAVSGDGAFTSKQSIQPAIKFL